MRISPVFSESSALECVPMQPSDLDQVTSLETSVQAFPWARKNFQDSLDNGDSSWIIRTQAALIGFAIVMRVLDEAHLLNIAIHPQYQGQGLGGRLLCHMQACALQWHARLMYLEVRASNRKAITLYHHLGFREIGQRKAYYPGHEGREDALVMSKELMEVRA